MVSRMMRWFPGWVRVEAEGGYPERLLNAVTAARIAVWGVRRHGECLRFSCLAGDYRALRPMARKACVRMRMRHKHGLPFWRHRYRHRRGLLVGLALYILVLAWLSPRIWVIEVTGNAVTPTETILAAAAQRGVTLGARMDRVDVKGLQIGGTKDMPTVSFITVNPSHNVARIEVTEREESPPSLDLTQPSDMVALRDGRILRMEVYSGHKLVMEGEAVTAGTRLVTGRVETELGEKLYRVHGNCDWGSLKDIVVKVGDVKIFATHGDLYGAKQSDEKLIDKAKREGCSVVLFGHTHNPEIYHRDGVLLINPGSLSKYASKKTFAYMVVCGEKVTPIINEKFFQGK